MLPIGAESVVLNQIAYARVEDVLMQCVGRFDVSDEELTTWFDRLRVEDYRVLLISTRGNGGLSAKQRSRVAQFWKDAGRAAPPVALLSDSAVARGVLTAIGWLLDNPTKAFSPQDLRGALAFLKSSVPAGVISSQLDVLHAALDAKTRRSA